ncbi:hypothetical protein JCM10908_005153 [Rhodotorula pacifica]|uniref:NAD(P)-dependent oxidoreductase n=1 Tax=Rhodotorula pacifica TaxID=1495444 RepID=UPI00317AD56C
MPRFETQQWGFLGLGNMGLHMANNLAKHLADNDHPALMLYNRTTSKLPAESDSIKHAKSAQQLAEQCDVVVTSLANDEAAKLVYAELFKGAEKRGKEGKAIILIDTSTLYPTTCGELEREATKIPGTVYLCSPVFGPPPMAKDAKLVFVLSGDVFAKKKVAPYLVPAMGRRILDLGSNVERAASLKLIGNGTIVCLIEVLSECMTLADRSGVGADLYYEFIKEFLPAPSMLGYGAKIMNNDFEASNGFTTRGGLKDATHVRRLAHEVGATMPALDAAQRGLVASMANGGADLDWSSLVAGTRLSAGLNPFTGRKDHPQDTGFGAKTDDSKGSLEPESVGGIKEVQNY